MGRVDGKTFVDRHTITLTDGAYKTLKQDFAVWAKNRCIAEPNAEKCDYYSDFKRIFRDGRVDRLEAKLLFYELNDIKGSDQVVDEKEIRNSLFHNYEDRESGKIEDRSLYCLGHTFKYSALTEVTYPKEQLEAFSDISQEIIRILKATEIRLGQLIETLEAHRWDLGNSEASFWTFVSPENIYGLSSRISFDDKTFSSMEHDGVMDLLRNLRRLHSGVLQFRRYYEIGHIATSSEEVQLFLNSFLADQIAFEHYFNPSSLYESDEAMDIRNSQYAADMVNLAMNSGAQRFAYALAIKLEDEIPNIDSSKMYDVLPNTFFRFCDGTAYNTANNLVSIKSLGFLVFGTIFGKILSSSLKTATIIENISQKAKSLSFLIPGATILTRSAGQGFWSSVGIFTINAGIEFGKASIYINIAQLIGGREASSWAGKLYDFSIGAMSGYTTGLFAKLGSTLEKGESAFAKLFFEKHGSTPSSLKLFARRVAENSGNKTLRLTSQTKWKKFFGLLEKEVDAIETALKKAERTAYLNGQADKVVKELRKLVSKNKTIVSPEAIKSKLNKIAKIKDPQKALKAHRRLLADTERTIGEARRATRAEPLTKPEPGKKGLQRKLPQKSNGKKVATTKPKPKKRPKTSKKPTQTIKQDPFDKLIDNPPSEFTLNTLEDIAGNTISATKTGLKRVQTLYKKDSNIRAIIWRRLKELTKSDIRRSKTWQPIKSRQGAYRAKVGSDTRIFVELRSDGKYYITEIKRRTNLGTHYL